MKTGLIATVASAAFLWAGAAYADCAGTCNTNNAACSRSGKDYGTCMAAWHTCKQACTAPPARSATPAPHR